jgi:DNA-binding transcriptional LysR family regulator
MTIVRYRHFLAVAEERHFGRAALRLGIAQPPLSQSIRRLEYALGVALFVRSTQTVRLTPAGEAFWPEARVAVAAADRAVELARAASEVGAAVRVGAVSLALFGSLPRLLRVAREPRPVSARRVRVDECAIAPAGFGRVGPRPSFAAV